MSVADARSESDSDQRIHSGVTRVSLGRTDVGNTDDLFVSEAISKPENRVNLALL